MQERLVTCVFVNNDCNDSSRFTLDVKARNVLCGARVVIAALTPTFLTLPNCIRQLRWAMDLSEKGLLKLVVLPLHPACTLQCLADLLADGPNRGTVYCTRAAAAVKVSNEGMNLVKRLVHGGGSGSFDMLECLHLRAWMSDSGAFGRVEGDSGASGRVEGSSISLAETQLALLSVTESESLQMRETLSCAAALEQGRGEQRDSDTAVCDLVDCIQALAGVQLDCRCVLLSTNV